MHAYTKHVVIIDNSQEFFQGGEHNVPRLYFSARVLKMHNNEIRTRTIALCGLLLFLFEIGLKLKK